jgi:hypothetical protein
LYGLLETCEKEDEIFLLDDLSAAPKELLMARNIIDILSSMEQEKTENLLRHLEKRSGNESNRITLILTDVPSFYEADDTYRQRLHSLIEQAEKRNLRILLFLTSSNSISFRDLSLISFRIALKNSNLQDLSGIFEIPVHKTVTEDARGLIHNSEILEVSILRTDAEMLLKKAEELNQNYGNSKPYEIPYLPEEVVYSSYRGEGIGLGIGISSYEWVDIPKGQKLLVLATYEEELYDFFEIMKQAAPGQAVMITESTMNAEESDAEIVFMKQDSYISSGRKNEFSSILYIGSGFRDQFRFTTSYKGDFHDNYGVFYEKGKNQVIQYAQKWREDPNLAGVSGATEEVRMPASSEEIRQ